MPDYKVVKIEGKGECEIVREFTANLSRMVIWRIPESGEKFVLPAEWGRIRPSTHERLKKVLGLKIVKL